MIFRSKAHRCKFNLSPQDELITSLRSIRNSIPPISTFLACTSTHPMKQRKRIKKTSVAYCAQASVITCLFVHLSARKIHGWPTGRDIKDSNPAVPHSPEMDHSLKKLSWLSPPCGREMFPSLICVSQMTWFPPGGRVLCEKTARAPLRRFHAI